MDVKEAITILTARGIQCRRDWRSTDYWLAKIGNIGYYVSGRILTDAAQASDSIAFLEVACHSLRWPGPV